MPFPGLPAIAAWFLGTTMGQLITSAVVGWAVSALVDAASSGDPEAVNRAMQKAYQDAYQRMVQNGLDPAQAEVEAQHVAQLAAQQAQASAGLSPDAQGVLMFGAGMAADAVLGRYGGGWARRLAPEAKFLRGAAGAGAGAASGAVPDAPLPRPKSLNPNAEGARSPLGPDTQVTQVGRYTPPGAPPPAWDPARGRPAQAVQPGAGTPPTPPPGPPVAPVPPGASAGAAGGITPMTPPSAVRPPSGISGGTTFTDLPAPAPLMAGAGDAALRAMTPPVASPMTQLTRVVEDPRGIMGRITPPDLPPALRPPTQATQVLPPALRSPTQATQVLPPALRSPTQATQVLPPALRPPTQATQVLPPALRSPTQATQVLPRPKPIQPRALDQAPDQAPMSAAARAQAARDQGQRARLQELGQISQLPADQQAARLQAFIAREAMAPDADPRWVQVAEMRLRALQNKPVELGSVTSRPTQVERQLGTEADQLLRRGAAKEMRAYRRAARPRARPQAAPESPTAPEPPAAPEPPTVPEPPAASESRNAGGRPRKTAQRQAELEAMLEDAFDEFG